MEQTFSKKLLLSMYAELLGRIPGEIELQPKLNALQRGQTVEDLFYSFIQCDEYKAKSRVKTLFPLGHYHSPIVDPDEVRVTLEQSRNIRVADISGIDIDVDTMTALWESNAGLIRGTPFSDCPLPGKRYHYGDGPYPLGDATILRLMISTHRPRHIIEIGSGFSSACILDTVQELSLHPFSLTCVEPYPDRLQKLIQPNDPVSIIQAPVQTVDLSIYSKLEAGDILLVDSTHVLKTGSDVNHELFTIFPLLKPGVIVHVHDCQFPFEYPSLWVVEQNYSWNEIYGLRAFLMYNDRFKVYFWNSLFARQRTEIVRATFPDFLINPGSAIWLRVTS